MRSNSQRDQLHPIGQYDKTLRPSRGFWGTGGRGNFFRGTKTILGSWEHTKHIFDFGGTEAQANLFQGNKGTGTPWEGLIIVLILFRPISFSIKLHPIN